MVGTVWLSGAPAAQIDLADELDTAVAFVVADGRIARIYAICNPHKLALLRWRWATVSTIARSHAGP